MSSSNSHFESKSHKLLILISSNLINEGFLSSNPYRNYDTNYEICNKVFKYYSESATDIDMEFFAKFILLNEELINEFQKTKSKSIFEKIKIPKIKNFDVQYSVIGSAILTEEYHTSWESYSEDWVKRAIGTSQLNGNFDYWEGEHINTEHKDFEFDHLYIDGIEEKIVNESVLSKLDKQKLQMLKERIEQKLRSF